MSTNAHFRVKIGFKFQSLGKISYISAADPPPQSFWVNSNTGYADHTTLTLLFATLEHEQQTD